MNMEDTVYNNLHQVLIKLYDIIIGCSKYFTVEFDEDVLYTDGIK